MQFSDGSRATKTSGFHHHGGRAPAGPVLRTGGGGGGGGNWRQSQWVWPLPPPGTLTLVCEWPAMRIELTRSELYVQSIREAAARAQVIFSDEYLPERPDEGGGGSLVASTR